MKKTTKMTNRKDAMDFCFRIEDAEKAASRNTLTTAHARKLLNDILARVGDDPIDSFSVREWCSEWIASKKNARAEATSERYRKPLNDFVLSLGARADLPLRVVTSKDIREFRDAQQAGGRAATTVNFSIKAISAAMEQARRLGYLSTNPVAGVDLLQICKERVEKGIFTTAEIVRLLAAAPSTDWQGVILLGYFAGLRLGDCLSLQWKSVDLKDKILRITPQKTARSGRELEIPMHPEIQNFFTQLAFEGKKTGPVFKSIAHLGVGGNNGASRRFSRIMKDAGIKSLTLREAAGDAGRDVSDRSFHSLRHSYVTALSTAGVAVELRQKLAGHASQQQNLHYTHPQKVALRGAIKKLPRLSAAKKGRSKKTKAGAGS